MNRGPQRIARVALVAGLLSAALADDESYRVAFRAAPDAWMDVMHGTAKAPFQYRVGVVHAAVWISRHTPLHLQNAYGAIDTISALVAGLVLLRVLERSAVYRRATVAMQWLGAACFVGLVSFYLLWLLSPQKPETLPAAMLVALMLRLWQPPPRPHGTWLPALTAVALVGLSAVLGLVRADVACLLDLGVFAASLTALGKRLSLPRAPAACTSLAGAAVAGGIQLYLMRVAYPQANYGRVKMWQLRPNLIHGLRWPAFVLFLLPVAWTIVQLARRRFREDAASLALLLGAGIYAVVWVTIGKIDEVRIFLPLALALAPLTVEMLMLRASEATETTQARGSGATAER